MPKNISQFNWNKFWEDFDIDNIETIEDLIFRNKNGKWFCVIVVPNSFEVLEFPVYYHPFTGEKLS